MRHVGIISRNYRVLGLLSIALLTAAGALFTGWHSADPELTTTAHAQSSIMLEQRLNQVEQRFNYIESRLNRLESESRSQSTTIPSRSNSELSLMKAQMDTMRADIDSLRVRTGELECAVLKLDERTLTAAERAARRRGGSSEPCRANTAAPVTLSARP
ncbi:MAG TPA: hypothetical protein VGJ02_11125 [Pyrinomonadaceae bacterium]